MFNYLGNMISYEKELDIDNKLHNYLKITGIINNGPPLWSSGQSFWLQIQRSRVRFPALPDFSE